MKRPLIGLLSAALLMPGVGFAGLVAYYSFDSDFSDSSGNSNHLTSASGTPNITTAIGETAFGGGALNLAGGDNEYLSLGTVLPFGASDTWSVSFWARRTGNSDQGMVMGNAGVRNSFIWSTDAFNGMRFRPQSSSSASNDFTAPKDEDFHHYVMVADGTGQLSLYVDNGTPEVIGSANGGTSFTINAIGYAYDNSNYTFDGQLDEIYIFDEAIDATKVAELYQGGEDTTVPTLTSITDDRGGGPVEPDSLVIYTVSFSEDMDDASVDASDFSNVGSIASYTIGTVTETTSGVFSVPVTPNETGTLQLQINQSAILSDPAGNDLDTNSAILDETVITVETDNTNPTLATGDIQDDQSGGPVTQGTTVSYTVTFSEDIDDSTVEAADFGNAGTADVTIGSITEVSAGVFEVEITPDSTGTLRLKVLIGAQIADAAGNLLDTTSAIVSDTVITVQEGFSPAGVKLLRVVFVAGQSNADGRAATSGLPTSPVNLQQPQEDVDFFYRVEGKIYPLTTLRPGLSETSGFGPAITCGRYLADELANGITTRVAVIKYANGGTNLYSQWAAGGDATTTSDGTQYVRFRETVTAGLTALTSTYPNAAIELVGMVWLQGESDSGSQAVNYETNLTNFIADVRLTYGADLRFVVIRLSDGQTAVGSLATIRVAQTAVAAADPLTGLVDSDGFGMKGDNLHFDATGQQQNGNASAIQLLNLYFMNPMTFAPGAVEAFDFTINDAFDGFDYTLQKNPGLQPAGWDNVESKTASGDTVDFSYTPLAGEENKQFFRIIREIAP